MESRVIGSGGCHVPLQFPRFVLNFPLQRFDLVERPHLYQCYPHAASYGPFLSLLLSCPSQINVTLVARSFGEVERSFGFDTVGMKFGSERGVGERREIKSTFCELLPILTISSYTTRQLLLCENRAAVGTGTATP